MGDSERTRSILRAERVSQRRIADELGISRQLVSAVLGCGNGPASTVRFSADTERQVLELARRLGYQFTRSAGMLSEIRVLVENNLTMMTPGLFNALVEACDEECVELAVHVVRQGNQSPLSALRQRSDRVVLVFPTVIGNLAAELELLQMRGHQVLQVNAQGIPGPRVLYDEAGGMRILLEAVRGEGRRYPVMTWASETWYTAERLSALRSLVPALGFSGGGDARYTMADALGSLAAALAAHPQCDAVVCEHPDQVPYVALVLARQGRRVPEDVRIVTYFQTGELRVYCQGAWCTALDVRGLVREVIAKAQGWCAGQPPPACWRSGYLPVHRF